MKPNCCAGCDDPAVEFQRIWNFPEDLRQPIQHKCRRICPSFAPHQWDIHERPPLLSQLNILMNLKFASPWPRLNLTYGLNIRPVLERVRTEKRTTPERFRGTP